MVADFAPDSVQRREILVGSGSIGSGSENALRVEDHIFSTLWLIGDICKLLGTVEIGGCSLVFRLRNEDRVLVRQLWNED
jgi:hypothetical protein